MHLLSPASLHPDEAAALSIPAQWLAETAEIEREMCTSCRGTVGKKQNITNAISPKFLQLPVWVSRKSFSWQPKTKSTCTSPNRQDESDGARAVNGGWRCFCRGPCCEPAVDWLGSAVLHSSDVGSLVSSQTSCSHEFSNLCLVTFWTNKSDNSQLTQRRPFAFLLDLMQWIIIKLWISIPFSTATLN